MSFHLPKGGLSALPLHSLPAIVADTETTGLDTATDRIIEIAAVRVHNGTVSDDRFSELVQPGLPVPAKSTEIHGIRDADLAQAETFPAVMARFAGWAGGDVLIGYSLGFDLAVLEAEHLRAGLKWQAPRTLDVRHLVQLVAPDLPGQTLDIAAEWLGIEITDRHRALGDALVTAQIFNALIDRLRARDIVTLAQAERACRSLSSHLSAEARADGKGPLSLLTCRAPDPTGYGRILREGDAVVGIREHKDASEAERAIDEINPGVYAAEAGFLRDALAELSDDNAQGELYLTDIVAAASSGGGAKGIEWPLASLQGVNDRAQLAETAAVMRRRIATRHARAGVTIRDLSRVDIDHGVTLAVDAVLEPGVVLRGDTHIGEGARLDVGCVLTNVTVDAGAYLKPYSVATDSKVGEGAQVGPFSHLRPGSELGPESHVGNFVETKKTRLGRGAKANHLAYLGDGIVEDRVNVGAGTIFCNYDGFQKHVTHLEEGCFIGSDSQLVAPIRVGKGAYVATGTTVTKNVPANALAVGRAKQENKEGYASRLRARLEAKAAAAKKK